MSKGCHDHGFNIPRSTAAVALAAAIVLSSLLTAAALSGSANHWLACISFLPFFAAVRWLPPMRAALTGGLWGAILFLPSAYNASFSIGTSAHAFAPSPYWMVLLIGIPAAYAGLAAHLTRRNLDARRSPLTIGLSLLLLAIGWTLVEAILHYRGLCGPQGGLLTGSRGGGLQLHWSVRLLGYIGTAFLVACANASLITLLSVARLSIPTYRTLKGLRNRREVPAFPEVLPPKTWFLRQSYPRGPPGTAHL